MACGLGLLSTKDKAVSGYYFPLCGLAGIFDQVSLDFESLLWCFDYNFQLY